MRKSSALISILLFLPLYLWAACGEEADATDSLSYKEYELLIQARGHDITGLCAMTATNDGRMEGTFINEFGLKVFDFIFTNDKRKAKVFNVFGPMNKWYIRKMLSNDMTFTLRHMQQSDTTAKGIRSISFDADGAIHVRNNRFKIFYTFTPIKR